MCGVTSDYIRQVGFITNPEGNEVTKVLFYSEFVKQMVIRAEGDLEKEGIRFVYDNQFGIEESIPGTLGPSPIMQIYARRKYSMIH